MFRTAALNKMKNIATVNKLNNKNSPQNDLNSAEVRPCNIYIYIIWSMVEIHITSSLL